MFFDNKTKYFSGWPNRCFGLKRSTEWGKLLPDSHISDQWFCGSRYICYSCLNIIWVKTHLWNSSPLPKHLLDIHHTPSYLYTPELAFDQDYSHILWESMKRTFSIHRPRTLLLHIQLMLSHCWLGGQKPLQYAYEEPTRKQVLRRSEVFFKIKIFYFWILWTNKYLFW